mgnify:CR=1 FL=1
MEKVTKKELLKAEVGDLLDDNNFAIKTVVGGWIYFDKENGIAVFVPKERTNP